MFGLLWVTLSWSYAMEAISSTVKSKTRSLKTEDTVVEMCQVIKAAHVNQHNILHSGQLLKWVDITACLSAEKLAGCPCVTVSVDDLFLTNPVKQGHILNIKAKVNRAFKTSMEVGVVVFSEHVHDNVMEQSQVCEAFLTFVAIDKNGKKIILPNLGCSSEEDEFDYFLAEERKKIRLCHSHTILNLIQKFKSDHTIATTTNNSAIKASYTSTKSVELVLPSYANHHGNTFGGQIMDWLETVSSISALRLCKTVPILRSVDMVHFRGPSFVGDRIILQAIVNNVFENSFEVGVRVEAYNCKNGIIGPIRHINSAFLSYFVDGTVPSLEPDSLDAKRRYKEALARRKIRLDKRYILSAKRKENLSIALDEDNWQLIRLDSIASLTMLCNNRDWSVVSSTEGLTLSTMELQNMLVFKVSKKISKSNITCEQAYNALKDITARPQWDPLYISTTLLKKVSEEDALYMNVIKATNSDDQLNNLFTLFVSCKKPTALNSRYLIAMRSVKYEDAQVNLTDTKLCEVRCAGFVIEPTLDGEVVVSYYNETNPQLVSYITSDIAGCSRMYSHVYCKMENYIFNSQK